MMALNGRCDIDLGAEMVRETRTMALNHGVQL